MAIIKQGILGGFSGSIANVTGAAWKGRSTVRAKKPKQNGKATPAMESQWEKMRTNAIMWQWFKNLQKHVQIPNCPKTLTYQQHIYSLYNGNFATTWNTNIAHQLFYPKMMFGSSFDVCLEVKRDWSTAKIDAELDDNVSTVDLTMHVMMYSHYKQKKSSFFSVPLASTYEEWDIPQSCKNMFNSRFVTVWLMFSNETGFSKVQIRTCEFDNDENEFLDNFHLLKP